MPRKQTAAVHGPHTHHTRASSHTTQLLQLRDARLVQQGALLLPPRHSLDNYGVLRRAQLPRLDGAHSETCVRTNVRSHRTKSHRNCFARSTNVRSHKTQLIRVRTTLPPSLLLIARSLVFSAASWRDTHARTAVRESLLNHTTPPPTTNCTTALILLSRRSSPPPPRSVQFTVFIGVPPAL
jgi:hypothetical protein